eukprot:GHVT01093835.1.p1 GENE.GHVT01093835.1~~GHVT01093835.1.p1  ORF type:complete len:212 (-),score=26.86 GHVT01093835.1:560-1195(-)
MGPELEVPAPAVPKAAAVGGDSWRNALRRLTVSLAPGVSSGGANAPAISRTRSRSSYIAPEPRPALSSGPEPLAERSQGLQPTAVVAAANEPGENFAPKLDLSDNGTTPLSRLKEGDANLQRAKQILQRTTGERTPEEVQILAQALQASSFFSTLNTNTRLILCKELNYLHLEQGQILFEQVNANHKFCKHSKNTENAMANWRRKLRKKWF